MVEQIFVKRSGLVCIANAGGCQQAVVYQATADGACNLGEVFTTDGRIQSLNLVVLEDDKRFFPAYNAAPAWLSCFNLRWVLLPGL